MINMRLNFKATILAAFSVFGLGSVLTFVTPNFAGYMGQPSYGPFKPVIIDADTLSDGVNKFRIVGVDACEMGQPIQFTDEEGDLNCGFFARAFVERFIGEQSVVCYDQGQRSYERIVARCFVGVSDHYIESDIGAFAIYSGWAVPTRHASGLYKFRYLLEYTYARLERRGAWNGTSALPEVWRSQN